MNSSNSNSVSQKYAVSYIQHKDRALSGATIVGQIGPGSNGNEGILRIPQNSSITVTSPSDCLVSYLGHSLGVGPSVYSTAPADRTKKEVYKYIYI